MVNKYNPSTSARLLLEKKIYADLAGNRKNQGIKSPWDNNVKKKMEEIPKLKKKIFEAAPNENFGAYIWDVFAKPQLGYSFSLNQPVSGLHT